MKKPSPTFKENIETKEQLALNTLEYHYLEDDRPFCVAYSGGKDSSVILILTIKMLENLKAKGINLNKKVLIINSNTLAELPPVLKYIQSSLLSIENYIKNADLPIEVKEVKPEEKHTLNVQLLGVGMPPPSSNLRWCTDKLKVFPIDKEIKKNFPDEKFISVIGTRKEESFRREAKINKVSIKGTNLKLNDRYKFASNLMPIENWTTKDVWEYLLKQNNDLLDIDFLWKLYSDASGKKANECSFVGAGGKHIEENKIGCGVSRFGCWQCYMVRDQDKSLDGLMKSGYDHIELYKEYRDWFWNTTQLGWEKTRDPYSHRHQGQDLYNKGGRDNLKYEMTMPKGLTLKIRKKALKKILDLQSKLNELIINENEIIEIQKRWILEGDLSLAAFKLARKHNIKLNYYNLDKQTRKNLNKAKKFYKKELNNPNLKEFFFILTLKRFAIQYIENPEKIQRKFFPSKAEDKFIRKEWEKNKKLIPKIVFINLYNLLNLKEGSYFE